MGSRRSPVANAKLSSRGGYIDTIYHLFWLSSDFKGGVFKVLVSGMNEEKAGHHPSDWCLQPLISFEAELVYFQPQILGVSVAMPSAN